MRAMPHNDGAPLERDHAATTLPFLGAWRTTRYGGFVDAGPRSG
jgi:hypothetical protein